MFTSSPPSASPSSARMPGRSSSSIVRSVAICSSFLAVVRFLREVEDVRPGELEQIGGPNPHRLLVGTGFEDDFLSPGQSRVDQDAVAGAAERWHGAELEVRIVPPEVLLGGEVDALSAFHVLAYLAQ